MENSQEQRTNFVEFRFHYFCTILYTRSPTSIRGVGCLCCAGALEHSLWGWLERRCSCWRAIKCSSARGSCLFENWSLWVPISREDRPHERIHSFRVEVATARVKGETAPPRGSRRRSSVSNSWTALSAMAFLLGFLPWPSSIVILCFFKRVLTRALKPGAGSVLITAGGPFIGHISKQSLMRASHNVWWHSFSRNRLEV